MILGLSNSLLVLDLAAGSCTGLGHHWNSDSHMASSLLTQDVGGLIITFSGCGWS